MSGALPDAGRLLDADSAIAVIPMGRRAISRRLESEVLPLLAGEGSYPD